MRDISIPTNVTKEIEFVVNKEQTAVHIGSGSISVLSTPSMILFMETASAILAHEYLTDGLTTVGTKVCIDHLAAVLEGQTVISTSTIKEVDGKKITFEVEVLHDNKLIGKGLHIRYIVNEKRFMEKLSKEILK